MEGGSIKTSLDAVSHCSPPFDELTDQPQPCGGSSSGSAVGVSAGFAPYSLGTETGGSLVYPARKAALYAMRPSLGTVSTEGLYRISRSFDGVRAMAKTPYDLAFLVESILRP